MIWPDFCSALIVGRLAPLGLHNTRFRSVPVSCSPRTGADASSPRHETHRNVANSRSLKSWKGLRRQTSSVLYAPSALPAMALSYESPTVPAEGSMPNSPTLVVHTRLMYCAPWYATPHSLQRKPQRMSDHIIPSNADDASADPRSAHVQPLIQPQRATTYTPIAYTRPVYGRQPAMPQAAAPQAVAPQTFGMPPQAAPRQSRPNSRFSYGQGIPSRRNGTWTPDHQCTFGNAIKRFFDGYLEFKGRSGRREFWFAMLFVIPVSVILFFIPVIGILWGMAVATPAIAISFRRLHDANRNGWWFLLGQAGNILALALLFVIGIGLLCIQIGMIMVIPHEPPNIDFHNPNSFAGMLLILFYASLGMVGVSLIIQACLYALPSKPEGARFD